MDMEILLWLQEMRTSVLDQFFQSITFLAEDKFFYLYLGFVYWCWNKNLGFRMGIVLNIAGVLNTFVKSVLRLPRPFLYDDRLNPVASAKAGATGFSFPSGHTSQAFSLYGVAAFQKGIAMPVRVLFGIVVTLTLASRLYLGVHTLKDVLVAAVLVLLVMCGGNVLLTYVEKNPQKDVFAAFLLMGGALLLAVISMAIPYDAGDEMMSYSMYKTYMDIFKKLMMLFAFLVCWIWDRRKLHYTVPERFWKKAVVLAAGAAAILIFQKFGKSRIEDLCLLFLEKESGRILARGISSFLLVAFVYGIYPWVVLKVSRRIENICVKYK